FRLRRARFLATADVVVLPRADAARARGAVIGDDLDRLWRKAGLLAVAGAQPAE
ncbi:MAG: hypothetical protein IT367_20820, partial [Candidatus Hydrogenedentes bacterium]|nr:hypothetical protein [Candidatus Hydrogenedentota bacterium]